MAAMDWLQVIILSVVQGFTEFLPISSSAHLILVPYFGHWADQGLTFDIALHVGTLLAVIIYFRADVLPFAQGKIDIICGRFNTINARKVFNLFIATIPILVFGYLLKDFAEHGARNLLVLGATSVGFGLLLGLADRLARNKTSGTSINDISLKQALFFGLFQALAIIPGTSRSGACITAGRLLGLSRGVSAHYGSLMAIPVIFILASYSLLKHWGETFTWQPVQLAVGIILSFAVAYAAIYLLMTWLARVGYMPFVIYRVILGGGLIYLALAP